MAKKKIQLELERSHPLAPFGGKMLKCDNGEINHIHIFKIKYKATTRTIKSHRRVVKQFNFPTLYFTIKTYGYDRYGYDRRNLASLTVRGGSKKKVQALLDAGFYYITNQENWICLGDSVQRTGKTDQELIENVIAGFWQTTFNF